MKGLAYGLVWESEIDLPFPPAPITAKPDITLIFDAERPRRQIALPYARQFSRLQGGFELNFEGGDGHWATYSWRQSKKSLIIATSHDAAHCWPALVGLIPAVLLRDRGCTLLHGAVVEINGAGFAIVGPSGAGKSTLAAGLVRRDARIVTDDLILYKDGLIVRGYTRIGLLADAFDALDFGEQSRAGVRWGDNKVQIRAAAEVGDHTPLSAVIALDPFDSSYSEPVLELETVAAALRAIRGNLYGDWIGPMTKSDGEFCLQLSRTIPVYRMRRSANFDQVVVASKLIEAI